MYQPTLFLFVISFFIFSCTEKEQKKKSTSNDTTESNPIIIDSTNNDFILVNDSITSYKSHNIDTDDFRITFPSEPNNDIDSTDLTNMYIFNNEGDTERYLLLIKEFTALDFDGQSKDVFLKKAVDGILSGFEPNEIGLKEDIVLGKYKGVKLMFGSPGKNFHSWLLFVKGYTLYQVIIVKNLEFPTNEEMALFNDSFLLK